MSFIIAIIAVLCSYFIAEIAIKTVILVLSLLCYVMYAVGVYKLFEKAEEKGWYAFIPILNDYTLYKISWNPSMYLPYIVLSVMVQYNKDKGNSNIFTWIIAAALFIVEVMFVDRLAKAYGRDNIWFKIGLFLFQPIFMMILGLSDAEYLGPQN